MTVLSLSEKNLFADVESLVNKDVDSTRVYPSNITTLLRVKRKIQEDPLNELVMQANKKPNEKLTSTFNPDAINLEAFLPKFKKSKLQHYYTFQRATPSCLASLPTSLIPPPPSISTSSTVPSLDSNTDATPSNTATPFRIVGTSIHEEFTILEVESVSTQLPSTSAICPKDLSSQIEALSLTESRNGSSGFGKEHLNEKKEINDNSNSDVIYDFYIPQWTTPPSSTLPSNSILSPHISCDVDAFPYFFDTLVHQDPWQENESDYFDDDEDSNAEDYYANDYPDESSHSSSFSSSIHTSSDINIHKKRDQQNDSDEEWDSNSIHDGSSYGSLSMNEKQKPFWKEFNSTHKNLFATSWSDEEDRWDADFSVHGELVHSCYSDRDQFYSSDVELIDTDF